MAHDIDIQRVVAHPLTAGIVGAVLGLKWAPGNSLTERLINVCSGAAVAGYVGPAFGGWLRLGASAQSALGFALGLLGLSMAGAIVDGIRQLKLADIISGWISRR
jgi:hypothetical protein